MPPASKEHRDLESGRPSGRGIRTSYYQHHPPTIVHPPENRAARTSTITEDVLATDNDGRSRRSNRVLRLFRPHFGKHSGGHHEQEAILQQQDLKSAGTFDTTSATATSTFLLDEPYEHPRSQNRMAKKWGKLKDVMYENAPDLWALSMAHAHRLQGEDPSEQGYASRAQLAREARENIRNLMEFSLWQCLLAMALYIGISVYCFSYWLEDWTVTDSVYFAIVTFTTIGYGDVVPDTRTARLFTCFWALSGVACLGIALGVLGSQLIDVAESEQMEVHQKHRTEVFDMFSIDEIPRQHRTGDNCSTASQWSDLGDRGVEDYFHDDPEPDREPSKCCSCVASPKTKRFMLLFTFLLVILFFMSKVENWNVWSTIYYGLITASTVGYGDLSPLSQNGRLLAILYIPVAVGVLGTFLDAVANAIIQRRRQQAQKALKSKELTLQDLAVMDADGDGSVTRAEFLEFMLSAMQLVDDDLLDNLRDHFDRLDKDKSGTLDKRDLINVAQYNLTKEKSSKRLIR